MTDNTLQRTYEAACAYPHTTPDMFAHAALVRIDNREIIADENAQRTLIYGSPLTRTLQGTQSALPTYNILFPGGKLLQHRIAILGIGSNCSPEVLVNKFQKSGIGGEFYLAQSTLDQHAVVHSAFVATTGSIPATVLPHQGTQSHITVGFYTPAQAEALTGTEPHYDLVHKNGVIVTRGLTRNPALHHGALLYVSIWGALTDDGANPMLQKAVPQTSSLTAQPTSWAIARAADICGYGSKILQFIGDIKPGPENLESRLLNTFKMHPQNALAARIQGTKVKDATVYKQAEELSIPVLPRITYF